MMTSDSTTANGTIAADPYVQDASTVQSPPRHLKERVRFLGPSLVLSAGVVGSGELIATTTIGATAGFALLWLIVASTTIKIWAQMELATWSILTGTPALAGYAKVPPRVGRAGWINVLWFGMEVTKPAACRSTFSVGWGMMLACGIPTDGRSTTPPSR